MRTLRAQVKLKAESYILGFVDLEAEQNKCRVGWYFEVESYFFGCGEHGGLTGHVKNTAA